MKPIEDELERLILLAVVRAVVNAPITAEQLIEVIDLSAYLAQHGHKAEHILQLERSKL